MSAVPATTARSAGSFRLFKGRSFWQKIWGGTLYWGRALQSQGIQDSFKAKGEYYGQRKTENNRLFHPLCEEEN
ncbi:hypothetical protein, partial [Pseudoflavonifractor sp. An176]|uniref:hypothetical protein n=1 Tax=Pseudoflavonifractor sp. An176 TaxID=1965572 RepID=UPI001950CD60